MCASCSSFNFESETTWQAACRNVATKFGIFYFFFQRFFQRAFQRINDQKNKEIKVYGYMINRDYIKVGDMGGIQPYRLDARTYTVITTFAEAKIKLH